jgi:hypothetical protein
MKVTIAPEGIAFHGRRYFNADFKKHLDEEAKVTLLSQDKVQVCFSDGTSCIASFVRWIYR